MKTPRLILVHVGIILILLIVIPIFLGLRLGGADRVGSIILSIFMFGIPLVFAYLGLRRIKTLIWINLVISIPFVVASGFFAYEEGPAQILLIPLFLYSCALAVINLIAIAVFWSRYEFKALVPIGISAATFILCVFFVRLGNQVNLYVFNKRISQFEDAVRMVENKIADGNAIRLSDEEIPEQYRHLAYFIYGEKEYNVLRVDFYWGRGGFPCRHVAYVYLSNDEIPAKGSDFRRDWYHCQRIRTKWFRASD
jgi:hypothetical protein